ncbi:dual specificity phosphatase domain protein (macronuclear) [Tetrahymena thermophila SB210]|uniref:Dual specificity phosphatase domain protein n=1 Tax=Tetrahymena thermophila (strain SB210) TaxID=312017 RepID=Q23FG5_TETTS|nr:dual specificity phosphatase domain protein [Tetrahymena thermophila SB210]EAR95188.2 dual specificity phosphatase domain protein [Tetrahymena thermophila SB210]|eukprot:XP_001015433.2 dual specificity phosphatase domain protein [Tetrahymena thermophila SB210]
MLCLRRTLQVKKLEFWDEILFAYRQQIAFGQKENFGLLQIITDKFLDVQQKRIAYHIRICMENKKSKRSKRSLIEESIENNPIDSIKSEIKCLNSNSKKGHYQRQEEYQNEINEDCEDAQNGQQEENDDYEYIYDDKQTMNEHSSTDNKSLNKEENESYEFCYQDEEIQPQLQKIKYVTKEKAEKERKLKKILEQLENLNKINTNQAEDNPPSQNSNEQWFYSNVKLVTKKKNKKQSANIY